MGLSSEEAVRYDRQVRLWGVEAQMRMMKSRVAIVNMGGLGTEIAKNLVLGGVGALTVVDKRNVSEADLGVNFLLEVKDIEKGVAECSVAPLKAMNSLVDLTPARAIPEDISQFTCIVATNMEKKDAVDLSKKCRAANVAFLACNSYGMLTFSFSDLGENFTVSIEDPTDKSVKRKMSFSFTPLSQVVCDGCDWAKSRPLPSFIQIQVLWESGVSLSTPVPEAAALLASASKTLASRHFIAELPSDTIASLARSCVGDFPPVSAVAGGVYAQEVLKVLHLNAKPINNFFVYDGLQESKGYAEKIG